jgi:threonine dehydrogenase-like Zn-dependent dehydrogenase
MGVSAPGTFAEHVILMERFVHRLPPGLDVDSFVLTEPLSCALTGVGRLGDELPSDALVLGGGPIGLLYGLVLRHRGLRVWVAETAEERRTLAAALFPELHHVARLEEASPQDEEWSLVVDTTGALADAVIPLLAPGGTLLLVGLRPTRFAVDQGMLADRSIRIVGSIDSRGTLPEAIALIAAGDLGVDRLLTHRFRLDQFGEALSLLGCDIGARRVRAAGRALKVVVAP